MAPLPKIDSEGLRAAKREGAARVSSVTRVRKKINAHDDWTDALAQEIVNHLLARAHGRVSDLYKEVADIIQCRVQ